MSKKNENGKKFQSFKWILLVCSTTIFVSCSNTNERKGFGLNGNVKSCFERIYEAEQKFGKWENGDIEYYGNSRVTFDKNGQYQEIEYYDDDMGLDGKLLFVRNKGKMSEQIYYDGDGNLRNKTVFIYDKDKVIEEIYYDSDGKLSGRSPINHISKNELNYESFDSDGKKTAYGKNISKDGKIIRQVYTRVRNGVDDEIYTTVFEYDKNGMYYPKSEQIKKEK